MTTATLTNSKLPRKQLSDQLDRLDGILDSLSEALNGAVADAAREGTRLALKDAVVEIMTDPTLRAKLHQASAPEAPTTAKAGFLARLKSGLGRVAQKVVELSSTLVEHARIRAKRLTQAVREGVQTVQRFGSVKNLALVGVGVGVTVGVVGFVAPHAVAAALSGVCGTVAAVAVQVGVWTRRTMRTLAL